MKRGRTYDWIPLWRQKWLWGSTRLELDPAERSVWIDFLCIAGNDDGYIRANETMPYPVEQLAGMLRVPVDALRSTISKCLKNGKLSRDKKGCLKVVSWENYQLDPDYKRQLMRGAKKDKTRTTPSTNSEYPVPIHKQKPKPIHKPKENKEGQPETPVGPLSESETEEKFEEFWTAYPQEGRHAKKESRVKFGALVKRGELAEFVQGFHGYLDFLKDQKVKNKFDQRPMYAKTFLGDRWEEFVGFRFEAPL